MLMSVFNNDGCATSHTRQKQKATKRKDCALQAQATNKSARRHCQYCSCACITLRTCSNVIRRWRRRSNAKEKANVCVIGQMQQRDTRSYLPY